MPDPLIAIVGSSDPERKEELGLVGDLEEGAKYTGEVLGGALARKRCRILVT
jgi:hypothetical protein